MQKVKRNVTEFNNDITACGGFKYYNERKSSVYSTERSVRAIREIYEFTGKKIMDVGSGDGNMSKELIFQCKAASVTGIEPAENAVKRAGKMSSELGIQDRLSFREGNIYDLEPGEDYDAVTMIGVLHHLPDAAKAIRRVCSVTDTLIILEPNGRNPILKLIEKTSQYHITHEEQSFTLKKITGWCENAGFTVKEHKYVNCVPLFCPDWLAVTGRLLEPLVERMPGIRSLLCGQIAIRAERKKE